MGRLDNRSTPSLVGRPLSPKDLMQYLEPSKPPSPTQPARLAHPKKGLQPCSDPCKRIGNIDSRAARAAPHGHGPNAPSVHCSAASHRLGTWWTAQVPLAHSSAAPEVTVTAVTPGRVLGTAPNCPEGTRQGPNSSDPASCN